MGVPRDESLSPMGTSLALLHRRPKGVAVVTTGYRILRYRGVLHVNPVGVSM